MPRIQNMPTEYFDLFLYVLFLLLFFIDLYTFTGFQHSYPDIGRFFQRPLEGLWICSNLIPGIVMDWYHHFGPNEPGSHHCFRSTHSIPTANREQGNIRMIEVTD